MRLFVLFIFCCSAVAYASRPGHSSQAQEPLKVVCSHKESLDSASPPYVETVGEALQKIGARGVKCTSCYRSEEEQTRACMSICGKPSCPSPNNCAAAGTSQHQRKELATCDLQGIPKGNGCELLRRLCDEKYGGKCGIGGYPGGGFHFGVGDDHFSAWSECKHLSAGAAPEDAIQRARFEQISFNIRSRRRTQ